MTNSRLWIVFIAFTLVYFSIDYANARELKLDPSARYRIQTINDSLRGDATASTLKLRLNASWQVNDALGIFVQGDHVHAFNDNYNSQTFFAATSPIPDVKGSDLNQFWFEYISDDYWRLKLGRQAINLDNERHVSSVEFWQNEQSFDAFSFQYDNEESISFYYAYVNKVHRIFGQDAKKFFTQNDPRFVNNPTRPFLELGEHEHNTHLLNLQYRFNSFFALSSYAYLIDNKSAAQLSSDTFGLRASGEYKPGNIKYSYTGEIAKQTTADNSPWDFSGNYYFVEVQAQYKSHAIAVAHEILSEDNGFAFATSLGNNHKFLGWADIFSAYINADGVKDSFVSYRGRKAKLRWRAMFHHYVSASTERTIGNELDLELAYRFNRKWQASALYSKYKPRQGLTEISATETDLQSLSFSVLYNF